MVDWWRNNGIPTYMAVSGYLGLIKDKGSGSSTAPASRGGQEIGNLEDLERMFAGTGGMIQ